MGLKKHTDIPDKVRERVYQRDSYDDWPCCIKCGSPFNIEVHHFVERSRGGMGIEQNLVCLCNSCHQTLHNGHSEIKIFCQEYLQAIYPDWEEDKLIYRKDSNEFI